MSKLPTTATPAKVAALSESSFSRPRDDHKSMVAMEKTASQPTGRAASLPKKKKRHSPFRIKVGCIVALRYGDGDTHLQKVSGKSDLEQKYAQVWTDPQPGRDQGLALIGKRVRCCFPKTVECKNRILEGEIVSLIDYEAQWHKQREATRRRETHGTTVELLIPKHVLGNMPFLERTDKDVDTSALSPIERKRHNFEEIIRGKDTVTVKVTLADSSGISLQDKKDGGPPVAKWVIRKRVALPKWESKKSRIETKPADNGENSQVIKKQRKKKKQDETKPVYVGDGNDSQAQQESNWRWYAGRYGGTDGSFIGEVLDVAPSNSSSSSTLAMVTLRRMVLPEHCASGRLSHHGPCDIFDVSDEKFQAPVEELVIVSRKFERRTNASSNVTGSLKCPVITQTYSFDSNSYKSLAAVDNGNALVVCHRCRKIESLVALKRISTESKAKLICSDCEKALSDMPVKGSCDCRDCTFRNDYDLAWKLQAKKAFENGDATTKSDVITDPTMKSACSSIQGMRPTHFELPSNFLNQETLPVPSTKPITQVKPRQTRQPRKKTPRKSPGPAKRAKVENGHVPEKSPQTAETEEEKVFIPSCSRLVPYDPSRKRFRRTTKQQTQMEQADPSKILSFDEAGRDTPMKQSSRKRARETDRDEKRGTNRAARANQRRMKKGVAAIGASGLGLDALAGREQQLRFDRSSIHAWGVFADAAINEGDMIIEYRGELIGNAVAEQREIEYEKAKIGSDYMFRIDAFLVCDATKQGNVARFINASCDPNCYTQIITLNGSKRIVIYAKRDIREGEELCYDYKFPFEYDESKRIPCHCGAQDCRGFMNWDKRYVALPAKPVGAESAPQAENT